MPEAISVLRKCIIEEYLSNWFTYEELAEYLCIDVDTVRYTLEEYVKLDKALLNKINRHREHIEDYINAEFCQMESSWLQKRTKNKTRRYTST